jgi:hypothetical protein
LSKIISIWCRGDGSITPRELAATVEEGAYFDDPVFEPDPESEEAAGPDWRQMIIQYEPGRRPIVINMSRVTDEEKAEILQELDEEFGEGEIGQASIRAHIEASERVVELDIDPDGLSDDGWEACDVIENRVATTLQGLIYVPSEGIYDANLQPLLKMS